jgi:hypothetical protein
VIDSNMSAGASESEPPDLAAFMTADAAAVGQIAPATLVYTPGGTRRQAALYGIAPNSDAYVRWGRQRMLENFQAIFRLGIRHLFTGLARASQFAEVGAYRERLLIWLEWVLLSPEALDEWQGRGWRVRLLGGAAISEIRALSERLEAALPGAGTPTIWFCVSPTADALWSDVLALAQRTQARTQAEIIRAICGEAIEPAPLWISSGKPTLAPDLLPFLVTGEAQCYWMQRPGYALDDQALRRILYDYAYLRPTWRADKSSRYRDLQAQRDIWSQPYVLGLGRRLGPFWYPADET